MINTKDGSFASQIHKSSIFKMSKKNKWYCFLGVNNFRRKWDVLTKHLHIINKVRYKNNGNQCWNRSDLSPDSNTGRHQTQL